MVSGIRRRNSRPREAAGASAFAPAAMVRALRIHEHLKGGGRVNAISLADELGMSDRTIKRDIERMRVELGAPIAWDVATHSYFYERECDILPMLRLSADEALALVVASQTFAAWRGSPLGRAFVGALDKIAGVVGGSISLPASEISTLIYQPDEEPDADAERRWLAVALEAIRRHRELRLTYQKPTAARPEDRTVHPLHLACMDHRWMLVAFDPGRKQPRNFLLTRIREATPTGRHFEPPQGFDLKRYLAGSIGRFTGEKEIEVRVAFDAVVAPYVRERPWHPSQTVVEKTDGRLEVTLRLNNLIDIQRRILACGSHAEVLAPNELRDAVRREVATMAARYLAGPSLACRARSAAKAGRRAASSARSAIPGNLFTGTPGDSADVIA